MKWRHLHGIYYYSNKPDCKTNIRNWEMVNAYQTILQGQQTYAQYLSTVRQQNQQRQTPGYPQENPAYTGDQYEQRPSDNYSQSQYQYSEPQYQYNNPNY